MTRSTQIVACLNKFETFLPSSSENQFFFLLSLMEIKLLEGKDRKMAESMSIKAHTLLVFDSFKMLFSALLFLVSGTSAFYPVPRYGDIYNPFFTHFAANQWLQPYYYRQINNNPYLFHSGKIQY